jgi:hypothetical protein
VSAVAAGMFIRATCVLAGSRLSAKLSRLETIASMIDGSGSAHSLL